MSARRSRARAAPSSRTLYAKAVFRPLKLKSSEPPHAHGELEGGRVALLREAVDLGAARVPEAEQAGGLVERLARRVVTRRPMVR